MGDHRSSVNRAVYYLWAIGSPILLTLGTIGNLLSIAVLTRRSLRSSSASVYLIALALSDTMVLHTGLLRDFLLEVADFDLRLISSFLCKMNAWLGYASLDSSVWILVAFTMERFLSVFTPHKVKSYCTRMSSIIIVVGIALTTMAINCHIAVGYGDSILVENNISILNICHLVSRDYANFFEYAWPWIDFCVYSLVPSIIMIVANSCTATRIILRRRSARRVQAVDVPGTQAGLATVDSNQRQISTALPRTDKHSSMTAILFVLNLVFLTTTLPVSVYLIVDPEWTKSARSAKDEDFKNLTNVIVNLIMYVNNSINFILYCLTGSRFRKELMIMFRNGRFSS